MDKLLLHSVVIPVSRDYSKVESYCPSHEIRTTVPLIVQQPHATSCITTLLFGWYTGPRAVFYETIVDREIFKLKIICVKNICVVKFSRSHSICEIFLTIDDCNMDEHLESSWDLVYYQVSGEPGIARYSR